ncbi:hypothetical protein [Albibacterium sp.]|uniref:hypothetical protein n=1 Tax=Albibacterium sp. TaxID=2952885 RepID=UPI002D06DD1B|nr:hypothetical protein [Albibacterium sp.]HUH17850.1 hypothetical protein [Albibacterium sp.]
MGRIGVYKAGNWTWSRVKASSIIEVVVALVIILFVFGCSTIIYLDLINHRPDKLYRLQKDLLVMSSKIKNEDSIMNYDQRETENGILIIQYCEPYQGDTLLMYLKLEAIENEKVVVTHKELFIYNNNEY